MTIEELAIEAQNTIAEYNYLIKNVIDPLWGDPQLHGFRSVLYGLLIRYASFIDVISIYYCGDIPQSKRMLKIMTEKIGYARIPSLIAIKTWRHTLVHQGTPRILRDQTSGSFEWLLHWDEERLGEQRHMQFQNADQGGRILNLCLERFLKDLPPLIEELANEITKEQKSFAAEYFLRAHTVRINASPNDCA